jgi:Tfp pilus assembly protein PilF
MQVQLLRADAFGRTGRVREAEVAYRKVLSVQKDNSGALNNLAFLMVQDGENLDEAMKLAKAGLRSVGRRNGLTVEVEGDAAPSASLLRSVLGATGTTQNSADRRLVNSLADTIGWIYLKKKMYDSAVQCFEIVLKDNPGNPVYHYHIGAALLAEGDKQRARTELKAALTAKPAPADESAIRGLLAQM